MNTDYQVALVRGFLRGSKADEEIMGAFQSIIGGGAPAIIADETPQTPMPFKSVPPAAAPKDDNGKVFSRWQPGEMDIIMDTTRQRRASGMSTGAIIKELMQKFPDRKYNAVYTKMMALGLISDASQQVVSKPERKESTRGE